MWVALSTCPSTLAVSDLRAELDPPSLLWIRSTIVIGIGASIQTLKFVHWQEGDAYLGYLLDYTDYWTQGDSLDDLKEHLVDLYRDLTSGELDGIRKVEELVVP